MKSMLELMVWMLVVGLVVAAFVLIALAIGAVGLGALLWLFLAAAHDRVVTRGTGIGYWRWWADRVQHLRLAVDGDRDESGLGEAVGGRAITRLEAQTDRLARRIERQAPRRGLLKDWTRGQDERRLEGLRTRLDRHREELFGRPTPPEDHHRAGDADREQTVAVLSRAHDEGRLDASELEGRVGRAYAATTYAELGDLVTDVAGEGNASVRRTTSQRASDRDREGAVSVLRAALDEGRLSPAEFSERVERAYEARHAEEVAALLADLPDSYVMRVHTVGRE